MPRRFSKGGNLAPGERLRRVLSPRLAPLSRQSPNLLERVRAVGVPSLTSGRHPKPIRHLTNHEAHGLHPVEQLAEHAEHLAQLRVIPFGRSPAEVAIPPQLVELVAREHCLA